MSEATPADQIVAMFALRPGAHGSEVKAIERLLALHDTGIGREIADEGVRAAAVHGEPADRSGLEWLAILAEEFGEAAMEVPRGEVPPVFVDRDRYRAQLRAELIQVASVAARWVAAIDRGEPPA